MKSNLIAMKKVTPLSLFLFVFLFPNTLQSQVWQREAPDTTGTYTGVYCSLVMDSEDRPHIAYYDRDFRDLHYAHFSAGRWIVEIVDSVGDAGAECSLALDAQDRPHISYRQQYQGLYWKLKYAVRTDSGWTKVYLDTPVDSAYYVSGYHSSIMIGDNGYPSISFVRHFPDEVRYVWQDENGWHMEKVVSVFDPAFTKLAFDTDNQPVIGFSFTKNHEERLAVARYDAVLAAWAIDTLPEVKDYGTVGFDLDSENKAYFTYIKKYDTLRLAVLDGETWSVETVTGDAGNYSSPGRTLTVDRNNEPVIVNFYYSDQLRVFRKKEGVWQYEVANTYKVHTGPTSHVSLAFDRDNNPHIAVQAGLTGRYGLGLFYYSYWPGQPRAGFPQAEHDFGAVWTRSYAGWNCVFDNSGDAPLIIDDYDFYSAWDKGSFSVAGKPFPYTVLPGGKDSLTVRFTPGEERLYSDTLFLVTNDTIRHRAKIALAGEGTASGTSGSLQVEVRDIYIDHDFLALWHDRPLQGAVITLYRDGRKMYGPMVTNAAGTATLQDIDTGSYRLRLVSLIAIPGEEPGTMITDSAGFSVMITTGPGMNTVSYLFPDSLLTEKYQDIYNLTHITKQRGDEFVIFHYPAEREVSELLDTWRSELPPETEEALSRLILAEKMTYEIFDGGYSLGNEFYNEIGELINIVYFSDSWAIVMWKWALDAVDALITHDVQPLMKDMLIEVLKEFLKSMIMDQVTYGIHQITAELGEPGETIFNTAWEAVRSNYSAWSIGEFSYTNWEKTIELVYSELRDPVLQEIYINLLTDDKIEKARKYSRDFQYGSTFRDAYGHSNQFVAGKLNTIENTVDVCEALRGMASLYYVTECIFAILGDFIDLLPGMEFVSAIRMAIKISAYGSVLTAMGISGYQFMALPGDLDRAVDDVYLNDKKSRAVAAGKVPFARARPLPAVNRLLRERLDEETSAYDSVLFSIKERIVAGDEAGALGKLGDLMQEEGNLRHSFLTASSPFMAIAPLAEEGKGAFQTEYDSLTSVVASAGQDRLVNYLGILFAPFDTTPAMQDTVIAMIDKASQSNHAVKDQILAVMNTVAGIEVPAVVVVSSSGQDKFGLKTGETATLQVQLMNTGALTAQQVRLLIRCNPALQVEGADSVYIGDLAPGEKSARFTFTVRPAANTYATGTWTAVIHANDSKTYSSGGTFTMHDAVSGVPLPRRSTGSKSYAYPNPFNPSDGPVCLHYRLPEPSSVTIRIYDLQGKCVRVLTRRQQMPATTELTTRWDGRNETGKTVPAGMYLYVIETGNNTRMSGRVVVWK